MNNYVFVEIVRNKFVGKIQDLAGIQLGFEPKIF